MNENRKEAVISLDGAGRRYGDLVIIERADLALARGEMIALVGPSGSGKSSLLHIAGLLEPPSCGDVHVKGVSVRGLDDKGRTRLRRDMLGFVYQFHHLLSGFSALDNVCLPQLIAGAGRKEASVRAALLLRMFGLEERMHHQPGQLSGGEQQRTAMARALANRPQVLLADEPTGNLDPETSGAVFDALLGVVRREGMSAIIATHDMALAGKLDRAIAISGKRLIDV